MTTAVGTIEVQYDDASGHLQTSSDENEITSQRQYDGFGRLAYVRARETVTKVTLAAAGLKTGMLGDMYGATQVQTSVTNGPTSVVLKDALGRTLQVVSSGVGGALIAQEYSYDSMGHVLHSSVPHLPTSASQGIIDYSYDEIGRLIGRTFPDASTVSHLFASSRSAKGKARPWFSQGRTATSLQATILPKGNLQARLSDESGLLLTAVESENVTSASEAHLTNVTRGAFGTVHTVTDPLGNVTTSTPDTVIAGPTGSQYHRDHRLPGSQPVALRHTIA